MAEKQPRETAGPSPTHRPVNNKLVSIAPATATRSAESIKESAARIFKESRAAQGMPPVVQDRRVILRAMRCVEPVRTYPAAAAASAA